MRIRLSILVSIFATLCGAIRSAHAREWDGVVESPADFASAEGKIIEPRNAKVFQMDSTLRSAHVTLTGYPAAISLLS